MPEQYVNAVSTSLVAAVTDPTATTIQVLSATGFPTSPQFRILVGQEIMLVTALAGAFWTVARGVENTMASTYAIGTTVDHIMTAGALDQIRADICNTGTYANRGSGSKVGDLYIPQDSFYDYLRWNGSSWDHFRNGRLLTPPVLASFTVDNQRFSTFSNTNGGITAFESPGTAGLRVAYMTAPATPYTITVGFIPHYHSTNNTNIGICWRDSSNGRISAAGPSWNSGWTLRGYRWTTTSTYNSDYFNYSIFPGMVHNGLVWMQAKNDGTNRSWLYSGNGVNWSTIYTVSSTEWVNAAQVGFHWGDVNGSPGDAGTTVVHWSQA